MRLARCSCRHAVVLASNLPVYCVDLPTQCFLFRWSGDFQAPSAARDQGFHPVGFWLQRLSWVKSVRYMWQIGDLVDGSMSPFSVDKLHYKDAVSVKARLPLLLPGRHCKSLACVGPLSPSARWLLFPSRLCRLFVRLHPWIRVSVPMWLIFVCYGRSSVCHVTAVFLFGAVLPCPVLL